jgi:hypothetical protein
MKLAKSGRRMNNGGKGEGQGVGEGAELANNGEVRDIMNEVGRTALLVVNMPSRIQCETQ